MVSYVSPDEDSRRLNINGARQRQRQLTKELTGQPIPAGPDKPRKPAREWLLDWIDNDASPHQRMASIRGVLWHDSDAWARRSQPNVVLAHYADLHADLDGQMRQLANRLSITVPESAWPGLKLACAIDALTWLVSAGKW